MSSGDSVIDVLEGKPASFPPPVSWQHSVYPPFLASHKLIWHKHKPCVRVQSEKGYLKIQWWRIIQTTMDVKPVVDVHMLLWESYEMTHLPTDRCHFSTHSKYQQHRKARVEHDSLRRCACLQNGCWKFINITKWCVACIMFTILV